MTEVAAARNLRATFKDRQRTQREVQTEASFVPDCKDLSCAYDPLASEQYEHLVELRQMIQRCLTLVAGDVYDVVSFKDILFQLESELPSSLPVTDVLLLSSRLFRRTAELGRLVSCFFGVVFAEDYHDEHFHFAEVRLLQREVRELKQQLTESKLERARLQEMVDNVGQVAFDHGKAVELLETHNKVLKKQTTALEDQMALLFHQLNIGLESHCKEAYKQVSSDMKAQESLNPTRTTFRQTMDSLSEQLRGSRDLITEMREVLLSCSQGGRTGDAYVAVEPSVRYKLKMLDSNFQQLMGRFSAVKDTVVETAQELMGALQERKKILYLSFQHIRLYDLQNAKMRNARAILAELQHRSTAFVQRAQVTFPSSSLTSVDRFGRISSQRWQGGYTLATLRGYKLAAQQQQQQQQPAPGKDDSGGDGTPGGGGASGGRGGSQTSPSRFLPGLTETQVMAAESELAALEGRSHDDSGAADPSSGRPKGNLRPDSRHPTPPPPSSSVAASQQQQPHGTKGRRTTSGSFAGGAVGGGGTVVAASAAAGAAGGTVTEGSQDNGDVSPFESVAELLELVRHIGANMDELQRTLMLDDEMNAFLKMLTLSISTTPRADVAGGTGLLGRASQLERQEYNMEVALQPTGNGLSGSRARANSATALFASNASFSESFTRPDSGSVSPITISRLNSPRSAEGGGHRVASPRTERGQSEAALARQAVQLEHQQEQILKMQEDFTSKIGFLRQVYEARIGDLEVRESTVEKKFGTSSSNPLLLSSKGMSSRNNNRRSSVEAGLPPKMKRADDAAASASTGSGDRDQLLKIRKGWQQAKRTMEANRTLREATVRELAQSEDEGDDDA